MPKPINLGNGTLLIGLDRTGQVKDFYYHYAGLENHVGEFLTHKIGLLVDNLFTWIDDASWNITIRSEKDTMASDIEAVNNNLGITLQFNDIVYNEKNIFIRQIEVKNNFDIKRDIKFFFNQQFNISQNSIGETAYYDPEDNVIIHYKGRRAFLANAICGDNAISEYSVGLLGIEGKAGTYKDAEDGRLSGNAVEHGKVDSVFAINFTIAPKKAAILYYWITVGRSVNRVKYLNKFIIKRGAEDIIKTTKDYWRAWVLNQNFSFHGLSSEVIDLFNKSLLIIRSHVNENGSIIASGDSSMLQYGRDTYGYVWPRDAAISAVALAKAGDFNASRRFFEFCKDIITSGGYFMHKYRPDKAMGSSWHPWVRDGQKQLPIQEDETALVINALYIYFELSKDLEFVESVYNPLIKSAAEFMTEYIESSNGLPKASYDLWEMKYGAHTFTAAAVYGALKAAAKFAVVLGKTKSASKYDTTANYLKTAIMNNLFNSAENVFYKSINYEKGNLEIDHTIDFSSIYGIYKFSILESNDALLEQAMDLSYQRLNVKTDIGGVARFEGDQYHNSGGNIPGNPWIITTLWYTQYLIDKAKNEDDLKKIIKHFEWVKERALLSGILSEQFNPYTGEQLSASPLIWSHAEYVITVVKYLEKLEELGICRARNPLHNEK